MKKLLLSAVCALLAGASAIAGALPVKFKGPKPEIKPQATAMISTKSASSVIKPMAAEVDYNAISDWTSIGQGKWADPFVYQAVGGSAYWAQEVLVDIEESAGNPGIYRLVDPYKYHPLAPADYASDKHYYMIVDCRNEESVSIPEFETGITVNGSMVWGRSGGAGKCENYVVDFEQWELHYRLGSDGGWDSANWQKCFTLRLPQGEFFDLYFGTAPTCVGENNSQVSVAVDADRDIASVKYVWYADNEEQASAFAARAENLDMTTKVISGDVSNGRTNLYAEGYDKDGNKQNSAYTYFYYIVDNNDQWETLEGTGLLNEALIYEMYGNYAYDNLNVQVQKHKTTEGYYRLVNPYANHGLRYYLHSDHNHYIYIHAEDPEHVWIETTPIGIDLGYGVFMVGSHAGLFIEQGKTFEDCLDLDIKWGKKTDNIISFDAAALTFGMTDFNNGTMYLTDYANALYIQLPKTHTISVKNANPDYGTVSISNPETAGTSYTGLANSVTIAATANEKGAFMYWNDAEGNTVSNNASYTIKGFADAEYTAYFGVPVNFTQPANGLIEVTYNGNPLSSGAPVVLNAEVTVRVVPNDHYQVKSLTANGKPVELTNNQATVTISEATTFVAEIEAALPVVNYQVEGNGSVIVASEFDWDNYTPVTTISSGAKVARESDLVILLYPGKEDGGAGVEKVTSVIVNTANGSDDITEFIDETPDGVLYTYTSVLEDTDIVITFSSDFAAILDIINDGSNAPAKVYNLQGVEVDGTNLAPGIYIVRQGNKTAKVYVK